MSICLAVLTFVSAAAIAQDYRAVYQELLTQKKYDALLVHLQEWEKSEPKNPEMFIAYFNYYINLGATSGISIDKDRKGSGETLQITDPETGEIMGYFNDSISYDVEKVKKGVEYLDKGLSYTPDRLDMHFGKIHILNTISDYHNAGKELFDTIVLSKKIHNAWLWSNNEKISEGEKFFLNNILDYYQTWLEVRTETAFNQIIVCAKKQIELYPKNIFAYNVLAVQYSMKQDYPNALEQFLYAKSIDGTDCVVLINIGILYARMNNITKSIENFEQVLEYGNEDEKEYAQQMLEQLYLLLK
jgi:tetratricopeptide (TPR) repeat protein